MVKGSKKKSYHHGDLRRALIDAALELIAERGPHGFNMREAARRAGVSSGAPYKHFSDKDGLIQAVADQGDELLVQAVDREMARAGDDHAARFQAMGIAYVKFAVANPSYFRVMTMLEYFNRERDGAIHNHDEAVHAIIDTAQKSGAIRPGDPRVVALAAQCLVYGLARMFIDGHLPSAGVGPEQAEAVAIAITGVLGKGILPRD